MSPSAQGRGKDGSRTGTPAMCSHPGVGLLLEIQFLCLGGAAGRAVQSHVTADSGPRLPGLVGWKGTPAGSGRTPKRLRAKASLVFATRGRGETASANRPAPTPSGVVPVTQEGGQSRTLSSPWPGTGFTLHPGPER